MKSKIGFLEIGIFAGGTLFTGLVLWLAALSFLSPGKDSEAMRIAESLGTQSVAVAAVVSKTVETPVEPAAVTPVEAQASVQPEPVAQAPATEPPDPVVQAQSLPAAVQQQALPETPSAPVLKEESVIAQVPAVQQNRISIVPEVPRRQQIAEQMAQASSSGEFLAEDVLAKEAPAVPQQPVEPVSLLDTASKPAAVPVTQEQAQPVAADSMRFTPKSDRDPMLMPAEARALERYKVEQQRLAEASMKEVEFKRKQDEERQKMLSAKGTGKTVNKTGIAMETLKKKLNVQGVLNTDQGVLAIVNNEIVGKGDLISGAKVVRVYANRVIFNYKGRVFEKQLVKD
ncbi:MAG: hypothetical protein AABZ44_08330 [Elusimicrobiota bacterium]